MRPLNRCAVDASGWAPPDQFDFSRSRSAPAVARVFLTTTPNRTDCLDLWEAAVSGTRSLSQDEQIALEAIRKRVDGHYKTAAPSLLDRLGRYCAYCELPVHEPLQVEHLLPKAQYPTFALEWDNFLPACTGCNSRKNNNPVRTVVATWLGATVTPDPADCEQAIRAHYRWPDRDPVAGYFSVGLFYDDPDGSGWVPCPERDAVDPETCLRWSNVADGAIRAYLPALGDVDVAALVYNADPGGDAGTDEMISLCKLNRPPEANDSSDLRTRYRTEAWLRAVAMLRPLGLPAALSETERMLIEATGFYWVWLTVAGLIDSRLRQVVIDSMRGRLPGTDDTRLAY